MDIIISFEKGGWKILPDPVRVKLGEKITWIVQTRRSDVPRLRWTIYFDRHSPFAQPPYLFQMPLGGRNDTGIVQVRFEYRTTTLNTGLGKLAERFDMEMRLRRFLEELQVSGSREPTDHEGAVGPMTTENPGEYKYGIKVENAETEEQLGDDDPTLIVG